jgi:6-phosphogluconolactonase
VKMQRAESQKAMLHLPIVHLQNQLRITLLLLFLLGHLAKAEVSDFYIGTQTSHSESKGIYRCSIDTDTGKLGPLTLAATANNPNFLAISPDHQFLFAALGDSVGSYRVRGDGALTPLNEQPSGGAGPCHVSLDENGRHLFVANYGGGNIACFPVGADGLIGSRTALMQFTGSGPDPNRQKKPYAHSIYADPQNKFVYACDLGSDSVWIFKFDPVGGLLVPSNPAAAKVPPGSGPRHLAFGPGGHFVYVANEMGASVSFFKRDPVSGALTLVKTVSTLMAGTSTKGVTTAEICFHPSGKWLYVSNRGCDTISVFAMALDGTATLVQSVSSVAKFPRSFAIDPTGKWLIAAGQNDNRLAVLKIDQATGELSPTDQSAAVPAPICVLFAAKK